MAFIFGSAAKGEEHAGSDIDIMLVGNNLSYGDILNQLESAEEQLGRVINPTLFTPEEFQQRRDQQQSFVTRVMEQPKLWLSQAPSTNDDKE